MYTCIEVRMSHTTGVIINKNNNNTNGHKNSGKCRRKVHFRWLSEFQIKNTPRSNQKHVDQADTSAVVQSST